METPPPRPETADDSGPQPTSPPGWLSRRRFVSLTGTALGAALLTGCRGGADTAESNTPPTSTSFAEPPLAASSHGQLEVTLQASPGDVAWRDGSRWAYTYNGSTPGPTLHVRPGDRLTIHLENDLDEPTPRIGDR